MRIGALSGAYTHAPSHNSSVGQTRAQLAPIGFASMIVRALPAKSPWAMRRMKRGMSIDVGHATVHGAS
jgi:hypothetical protein